MNFISKTIALWIKNYWLFLVLCVIIIVLLLILIFAGEQIQQGTWPREVISALLGAATVAVITYLLLKGQANNENLVQQNKKVFENRLKAYESFMTTLQKVVVNNKVDQESEKMLQFGIVNIGMHADSRNLLIVSKNLKYILQKINVQERADGSIWNELMEVMNVFHHSLYIDNEREIDTNMRKALRNFSGLCVDENYEVLQFIECLLSSHNFDSFISGKCLFYSIPVKKKYNKHENMPHRIYVTIRIDLVKNSLFSGIIAIYCPKGQFEKLRTLMNNPRLWLAPAHLKLEKKEKIALGVNVVNKAFVLPFLNIEKMVLQSIVCDIFNFMHPLWAEKGVAYLRKDKDGILIREIPNEK